MTLVEDFTRAATLPIEQAVAVPLRSYSDPQFYEQEVEKVFHGDWVFVCNSVALGQAGDRFAVSIAGEPVVVVRGKDGQLRALSNVCTHRGTPLADDGFSSGLNIVCPYHSWNFTLDGSLKGAPHTGSIAVDLATHCLPEYRLEEWHGLVFVNIDGNAESLTDRYAFLAPYMQLYQQGEYSHGKDNDAEIWDSNWKLVMENAMESYHLFKVHKETLETVSPTHGAFYVEGGASATATAGEYTGFLDTLKRWTGTGKQGPSQHYLLLSLPPSFVGVLSADGSHGYLSVLPDGPGKTRVRSGTVSRRAQKETPAEAQFTEGFLAEDRWICERAYRSMESRHARGGKLVELERVVQDFHRYLAVRLSGVDEGPRYRNPDIDQRLLGSG